MVDAIVASERAQAAAFFIAAIVIVVGPRSAVFLLPLLAVLVTVLNWRHWKHVLLSAWPIAHRVVLAFAALGMASALWAPDPLGAATQSFLLALMVASLVVASAQLRLARGMCLLNMAGWSVIGFALAALYLTHEVLSDQSLLRWIINALPGVRLESSKWVEVGEHVASVSDAGLKWSIASLNLILWPMLAIGFLVFRARARWLIMLALLAFNVVITFAGTHTTSQIAFPVAAAIFALSLLLKRRAGGVIAAIWVVLVLGALPLGYAANSVLQYANVKVGSSFGARAGMWEYIASEWVRAPVLGIGARGSYARSDAHRQADDAAGQRATVAEQAAPPLRHPHNVYLQVWLELGLIGAVLFLWAGYLGIRATEFAAETIQPFLYAGWAAGMILISSTWDLWQSWFGALFATSALFGLIASRLGDQSEALEATGVRFAAIWLPGGERGLATRLVTGVFLSGLALATLLTIYVVVLRSTVSSRIDALALCATQAACRSDADRLSEVLSHWAPYTDASPYTPFRVLIDGQRLVLFRHSCREIPRHADYFSVRINPYDKTLLARGSSTIDQSFRFTDRLDKTEGPKAFVSPKGCVGIVELQTDRFIAVAVGRYDVAQKKFIWRHVLRDNVVRLD